MSNFGDLQSSLRDLNEELRNFTRQVNTSRLNRTFRMFDSFQKSFKRFLNIPIVTKGITALDSLKDALEKSEKIQKDALASNRSLVSVISTGQIKASLRMGVSLNELAEEINSLKDTGIVNLEDSTLALAARMKATGQSTQSLIKFLGANTSVMNLNQYQAQKLAKDLSEYSKVYQTRQDEILNLTAQVAQSFRLQSQLGAGGIATGFTALAAQLGERSNDLISKASNFFAKASLSQLELLGIAEGFQERAARETDPAKQAAVVKELVKTAASNLKQLTGGLGTDTTSTKILEQILKPFGGMDAVGFLEVAKALEDAKAPMGKLSESITTFSSIAKMFFTPLEFVGSILSMLINLPILGDLVKGLSFLAGAVTTLGTLIISYKAISFLITNSSLIYQRAARVMSINARMMLRSAQMNLAASRASRASGLSSFLGPLGMILGPLALIPIILGMIEGNTDELNQKTPSQKDRDMLNSNLTGQIFSQLVNIVNSSNSNSMDREMLSTQKELVKIAKLQYDRDDPMSRPTVIPGGGGK